MNAMEFCSLSAVQLQHLIANRKVSAQELLSVFLKHIDCINPTVNAICTLAEDQAMQAAQAIDRQIQQGQIPGPLAGLPIAIKDLVETKGIKTTLGSPLFQRNIPNVDQLFVERLKKAGAIIIGKTNTPEFGAGSHTFNTLFGATRNPYDLSKSAGGSSGGAAAALAARMLPFADGSDLGGSLRNPAAFCNVVGFRPSPGRVPAFPNKHHWDGLPVLGPMARSVEDVALLLSVMAGPDPRAPNAIEQDGSLFLSNLDRDFKGCRIAWSPDLGHLPVQDEVLRVCENALSTFTDIGCSVDQAQPDLKDASEIFQQLRAAMFAANFPENYQSLAPLLKQTVIWNIEQGYKLSARDVVATEMKRSQLYDRAICFFDHYDFLVLPTTQVLPFPVEMEYPEQINSVKMNNYLDWMESCYAITLTGFPAISIPCGFSKCGLPVGLQIVAPHHQDFELLQIAHAFEKSTHHAAVLPGVLC